MLAKEQTSPPPKAVNIIRPSSPFLQQLKRAVSPNLATPHDASQSSSTASSSSPSTLSTLSSGAGGRFGASSLFSFYAPQHKPILGPNRFLQRPRSNSNLSKITSFSSSSDEEEEEEGDDDDSDEIDSIDGNTDNEDEEDDDDDDDDENDNDAEEEQVSPSKIVARIKHGTIMNGRGEFVSKGSDDGWLDEARANRKIADLEIEKTSLLAVNKTLEATVRRQAERILELEKRLEINNNNNNNSSSNNNNNSNDGPLTPLSDKHVGDESPLQETTSDEELENDQVFQRLKTMLQTLIDQAEAALIQKSKISGRVLTDYNPSTEARRKSVSKNEDDDAVTIRKLAVRRSWSPTHGSNTAIMNRQHQRPPRRGSDSQDIRPRSPRPVINHTKTSMARTLSRSSSPAVMVSSPTPPASPITRSHSPVPFNNTMHVRPPSRTSSLRSGHSNHHHHQQQQQPRWQY